MENIIEKCWLCNGYGYLPSDWKDTITVCPACDGTGKANEGEHENE